MKTRVNISMLILLTSIFFIDFTNEVSAQRRSNVNFRDHRIQKTKKFTSNNSRTKRWKNSGNKNSTNIPILFFDEGDAIFGKRTAIYNKNSAVKFTGKTKTIWAAKKVGSRKNISYKMPSGNTLYADVKNGKILKLKLKGSNRKLINAYPVYESVGSRARKAQKCLNCTKFCVQEYNDLGHPVGNPDCQYICKPVKCSSDENNGILVGKAKK